MKKVKYLDVRSILQTGDEVYFSGNSFNGIKPDFFSIAIKIFSRSRFTHVGTIIRKQDLKVEIEDFREGAVLLFESTTQNKILDVMFKKKVKGVSLVYLSDKIKNYSGRVYIRGFKGKRTHEMVLAMNKFVLETHGRPYEKKISELFFSCIHFFRLPVDEKTLFCSELTFDLKQKIKVISDKYRANNWTPGSLSKFKDYVKGFKPLEIFQVK